MGNTAKRANGTWRARYRDDSGRQQARHFERSVNAQRWLTTEQVNPICGHCRG